MERAEYTEVNYIVEASARGGPWFPVDGCGDDEGEGWASYERWMASKAAKGFKTKYRLVKRTAVITDEVLGQG